MRTHHGTEYGRLGERKNNWPVYISLMFEAITVHGCHPTSCILAGFDSSGQINAILIRRKHNE